MVPGAKYLQWSLWLRAGIAMLWELLLGVGADRIVWGWGYHLIAWMDGGAEG